MRKRVQLLAVLAAATISWPLPAGPGDDLDPSRIRMAQSATDQGNVLLKQAEYERAEDQFRRAIEYEARFPPAHLGLGAVLVATGRYQPALEVLREAERRFADLRNLHQVAGLRNRQHFANRERELEDASRQASRPGAGSGNVNQGAVEREVELDRRIADRLRPEEVDGIPAQVFYLEGIALLRLGLAAEGIEALETALYVDDDHGLAHYNLAVALFVNGEVQRAKGHLDAAVEAGASPHPQFVADLEAAVDSG